MQQPIRQETHQVYRNSRISLQHIEGM